MNSSKGFLTRLRGLGEIGVGTRRDFLTGLALRSLRSLAAILAVSVFSASSADWPQFHGPAGTGIALDAKPPIKWSDAENVQWKKQLPGAGTSRPIVTGQKVVVTCWA